MTRILGIDLMVGKTRTGRMIVQEKVGGGGGQDVCEKRCTASIVQQI